MLASCTKQRLTLEVQSFLLHVCTVRANSYCSCLSYCVEFVRWWWHQVVIVSQKMFVDYYMAFFFSVNKWWWTFKASKSYEMTFNVGDVHSPNAFPIVLHLNCVWHAYWQHLACWQEWQSRAAKYFSIVWRHKSIQNNREYWLCCSVQFLCVCCFHEATTQGELFFSAWHECRQCNRTGLT